MTPSRDGNSVVNARIITTCLWIVLCIATRKFRNRRGAQSDQGWRTIIRISLKVTPQASGIRCNRKPIRWLCKMVNPNRLIATTMKNHFSPLRHQKSSSSRRKCLLWNHRLTFCHPWNMCIAIQCDSIWIQAHQLLNGSLKTLFSLIGKTIQNISIQTGNTAYPTLCNTSFGYLERLLPTSRLLDLWIEILNTDRNTVHSMIHQHV